MANDDSDVGAFLAGFVIGGLVGAATALILAPQSGEETRVQLREKGIELRTRAEESASEARVRAEEAAAEARRRADELALQARDRLHEGQDRVRGALDEAVDAARRKKAELTGDEGTLGGATGTTPPPTGGAA